MKNRAHKNQATHLRVAFGLAASLALGATSAAAEEKAKTLELYVDPDTQQVYVSPGEGRVKLGTFEKAQDSSQADPLVTVNHKGLVVSSADKQFRMNLGGRIHIDASSHDNDQLVERGTTNPAEAVSGTDIRRARLAVKGNVSETLGYVLEVDWGGNKTSVKDAFVVYDASPSLEFTLGNQKHAVSMEIQESSNDIMFNERSLLSALTTPHFDRAIGFNAKAMGQNWSLQGGVYGDAISSSGNGADEGGGWGARGTIAPVNSANQVLHIGASLGHRKANDNNTLSNSSTPRFRYETTALSDLYLSNTGAISGFESVDLATLELAAKYGPFSVQSEYGQVDVERDNADTLTFDAYYLQFGWTLSGESRRYKGSDGEFKRLEARNPFNPELGHWGAWELALRLDELDLEDADISGGSQQRVTLNLNWYLNKNLRVLLGYSRAFDVEGSPLTQANGDEPDDIDVINLRTQIAF